MSGDTGLSQTHQELIDVIGIAAFLRLVEGFGGRTDVLVHVIPRPDGKLAKCLGAEAYAKLQPIYKGMCLTPPLLHTGREAMLVADVLSSRKTNGETIHSIARRHRIPMRKVYRILERDRAADDSQGDLFSR